nr:hypothetical protein [uncultured Pseudomonas sp.]
MDNINTTLDTASNPSWQEFLEGFQKVEEAFQEQWNTLQLINVLRNIEKVNSYGLANILR